MLFSNVLSTLLIFISSAVLITAGVVAERSDAAGLKANLSLKGFEGYAIVENVIQIDILGQKLEMNGTASQVYAKLEHKFGADAVADAYAAQPKTAAWTPPDYTGSAKRNLVWDPECPPIAGQSWERCEGLAIQHMASTLDRVGGTSSLPRRSCVIVECNNLGVTILCNDREDRITVGNKYLATYVDAMVKKCWRWTQWPVYWEAGGRMFDTDHYNVISIKGSCATQV